MDFENMHSLRLHKRRTSASGFVEHLVTGTGGYDEEEIDALRSEVNKLTEIVGKMFARLPADVQIDLAKEFGFTPVQL